MAKTTFGLDIGTHSVKLVQMQLGGEYPRLVNYTIQGVYAPDMDYDVEGPPKRLLLNAVRDAFKEIKVNPKRAKYVNSSMGGRLTSAKQIKSIPLSPEEMESSLIFEARKHLPLDDSEPIIDYQILDGDMDSQQMDIMLVATTRKAFQGRIDLLRDVGIKPNVIDSDILALVNCYLLTHGSIGESPLIFLDVGARMTNLIVYGEGAMFFAREIPWAGFNFTDDIRDAHDLDYPAAESYKIENGIFGNSDSGEDMAGGIRMQKKRAQDNLADEIHRSLRYYIKETSIREFEKILLSGGSSRINGLAGFIGEKINIPVELFNPTEYFELPQVFNPQHAPQIATACGLALREE
ncbi:MAG: type IV pilus assembly protein PilM [candidate division Zixibacteria bacterium]|nr:type IV pilus assembly protein PilM [candidate division Zixibacteria bacterium]